mmetsp:Transcript_75875/g.209798  ORF Transcript_75875/g.209798 Transcript_75875/m.209798 type:complete len:138 (+) Transcript_75875:122-535(+)
MVAAHRRKGWRNNHEAVSTTKLTNAASSEDKIMSATHMEIAPSTNKTCTKQLHHNNGAVSSSLAEESRKSTMPHESQQSPREKMKQSSTKAMRTPRHADNLPTSPVAGNESNNPPTTHARKRTVNCCPIEFRSTPSM